MVNDRRFPVPWRADKISGGYVVRDANSQALIYVCSRDNDAEALQAKVLRRIAINGGVGAGAAGKGDRDTDNGEGVSTGFASVAKTSRLGGYLLRPSLCFPVRPATFLPPLVDALSIFFVVALSPGKDFFPVRRVPARII